MTCPICCETYSKTVRKEVTCLYCAYSACIKCQQQYMLTVRDPQCMNCHVEWNREFIDHAFSKAFRTKTLKAHRERILLDLERAMLPDTMPYVEWEIQRERDKVLIQQYRTEIIRLRQEVDRLEFQQHLIQPPDAYFGRGEAGEQGGDGAGTSQGRPAAPQPKLKIVHACPATECRGFLDSKWSCGLCKTRVCGTCREVLPEKSDANKDLQHVCKPEQVATAKLLDKDTKSCPNCNVLIHRVFGCNQMWCTSCHTAFDWKTGRIETKHIHNPHYMEWLRRTGNVHAGIADPGGQGQGQGQQPGGQAQPDCNAILIPSTHSAQTMVTITTRWAKAYSASANKLLDTTDLAPVLTIAQAHQALIHLYHVIFLNLRGDWNAYQRRPADARNRDLRIAFLRNKMTEVQMQRTLQQREKKRAQQQAFVQLMQMFLQTGGDGIERVIQECRRLQLQQGGTFTSAVQKIPALDPGVCGDLINTMFAACNKSILELETLRGYFNEQMELTCNRFQCKAPIGTLLKDWRWATS